MKPSWPVVAILILITQYYIRIGIKFKNDIGLAHMILSHPLQIADSKGLKKFHARSVNNLQRLVVIVNKLDTLILKIDSTAPSCKDWVDHIKQFLSEGEPDGRTTDFSRDGS